MRTLCPQVLQCLGSLKELAQADTTNCKSKMLIVSAKAVSVQLVDNGRRCDIDTLKSKFAQ